MVDSGRDISIDKSVPASGWQTRPNWLLILRDLLSGLSQPGWQIEEEEVAIEEGNFLYDGDFKQCVL